MDIYVLSCYIKSKANKEKEKMSVFVIDGYYRSQNTQRKKFVIITTQQREKG
jgi:hypothetical protein